MSGPTPAGNGPPQRILVVERTPELAARIRHNVAGPGAVVKNCPDIARAETHLAAGPWDVIVAGPSCMHRSGLRQLGSLHQRYPWVAIVLALHERPRADLAEIVQTGADDLVPLHADDNEFRGTLARAARITRGRLGVTAAGAGRGRIVMVSSASGGCGKTFLATNAAEFLVRTTGQPVVLLDLDLQFGEVSTALRLRPDVTITDALTAEAEGYDLDEVLDGCLIDHQDGFQVLAAPRFPAEADSITPGDITRILDVLRARQAWVVIDTHEGLGDLFVAALEATDHVFAVATPDRPSLVNLGRLLGALNRLGMAAGNISVVLNKVEDGNGLDLIEMAAELGRPFEAIVPYSRDVSRSVNIGVPLIIGKPKSPIAKVLTAALAAVLPANRKPAPAPVPVAGPKLVEATAAGHEAPDSEPTEIDLSEHPPHACLSTARARPGSRCRWSTDVPMGDRCRGRGPPRPRATCGPDPPVRRAEVASSTMRAPPAVVASRKGVPNLDRYCPTRTPH